MRKNREAVFFPLLINISKFPCLVVGGGEVALRKVLTLQEFNAEITIVSPKFCKPLIELAKNHEINIIQKSYSKELLKNFKIVFCATDNEKINQAVYQDCTELGILINSADNPALCDFILPANIKRGDLTISVSSQGKAPFYTKEIKKKLNDFISPVYSDIMNLAGEFREQLLKNEKTKSARIKTKMFKAFTSKDWEKILTDNSKKNSQFYIQKFFKELKLF